MRKLLLALAFSVLSFFPASANWTGKDATPATITFYNPAVCTSVVCVPVFQLTDGTNQVTLTTAGADGVSNTLTGQPVYGRMFNFNGTTWDRWTGAVKLNATPTLANGNGVVPTQGGAVLSATNGLYANILQGNAVNSLTNPFFMSPATGATWSITAASSSVSPGAYQAGAFADGASVTEGLTTDAAATAGAAGTFSAKFRLMTTQLNTLHTDLGTLNTTAGNPLAAGTNIVGKFGIDQTTPGTTNLVAAGQNGSWTVAATPGTLNGGQTFVSGTTAAMTGTTSTQVIAAVTSNRLYITRTSCKGDPANAVGTKVQIQDGSGGTVLDTLTVGPNGGGEQATGPTPLFWTTAGNALFAQNVTTGASVICTASGYSGL